MEPDFSGWASKAGIRCSDGRTIMPDAFKGQDAMRVPLVWQHGHTNPENVLGHAILENRPEGIYAYAFFNKTPAAVHAAASVEHGDVRSLSIWANNLVEKAGNVIHGVIREVSLVLSGANPGAIIESITIRHSDGSSYTPDDEAIIHTGLELDTVLVHNDPDDPADPADPTDPVDPPDPQDPEDPKDPDDPSDPADPDAALGHDGITDDSSVEDIYNSMTEPQQKLLHFLVSDALESAAAEHSNLNDPEGNNMNVFERQPAGKPRHVLSHDAMKDLMKEAEELGSLKKAVERYAGEHLEHGITDIDILFPEARALNEVPEWNKRRTEWVVGLLAGTRKSPFSRIKTLSADITHDDARAKGYVKGDLKKEEFFGLLKRITTPTTVYKKQALDRDDIVDITDFDVVAWLKGEMRIMLDEEIARAILISDGRDISSEDKINEQCIRPIAKDHELYVTTVNVNIDDANSSMSEVVDTIVMHRHKYRGTGQPNFYTTELWISKFMLMRDGMGRRLYRALDEVAAELRVAAIIPVEVMEDEEDIIGIMVNPIDYVVGADRGGQVSMFDDFDIDYNKHKYLIETRISGALTKIKSAVVVRKVAGTRVLIAPNFANIAFNPANGQLTVTNQANVVFKNGAGTVINATGSPYTVAPGTTYTVKAEPASGYYFQSDDEDERQYTRPAS